MERKRVLVSFGDLRGFRKWIIRGANAPEVSELLIENVYSIFEEFHKRTGYYVKYLADGILIVKELGPGHNCGHAKKFLNDTHGLALAVMESLKDVWPRPDGFRIRDTSGYIWKRSSLHHIQGKWMHLPEYIGYALNMAHSLLYVYPEELCICTEGFIEIIGQKRNGLVLERLPPPDEKRQGIDPQDFLGLYSVRPHSASAKDA